VAAAVATKVPMAAASSPAASTSADSGKTADTEDVTALKSTIHDLNEKLETLKLKRAEDREKLREIEKYKMQIQTVNSL
jgi:dynactin 1